MIKSEFYVVWQGWRTGVFGNWADTKEATNGYPGAQLKGFKTLEDAKAAFAMTYEDYKKFGLPKKGPDLIFPGLF